MDNNDVQLNTWHPSEDPNINRSKSGFGGKLASLIIKISGGMVKDEKQANYVILGLVAIIFIISFVIFLNATSSPAPTAAPSEMQAMPEEY